jgi:bacillopeptidase F (M6 metalloprotease family)
LYADAVSTAGLSHIGTFHLPDDRCRHVVVKHEASQEDAAGGKVSAKADSQPVYKIKPNRALPKRSKNAAK